MRILRSASLLLMLASVAMAAAPAAREPVVGGPCEGCEAVFEGRPDTLTSTARIAPATEPGEPLRIVGVVRHEDGTPAPGAIVYAYHTNVDGVYPRDETLRGTAAYRHGTLRGWAQTDAEGRYRFDTVRPGGYPGSDMPQHIHVHVIEPGCCTYYIDDIVFTDDPRLSPRRRDGYRHGRGGDGVVTPERLEDGAWFVRRDIVLGRGIADHPDESSSREDR